MTVLRIPLECGHNAKQLILVMSTNEKCQFRQVTWLFIRSSEASFSRERKQRYYTCITTVYLIAK